MLKVILGKEVGRLPLRSKALKGFAARETLRGETAEVRQLLEKAASVSLFGDKRAYLVDLSFENETYEREVTALFKELASSEHLFIFEKETGAPLGKAAEKAGGELLKAAAVEKIEKKFDVFALAGALAKRDKKALWLLYQEALDNDQGPEVIAGILAWKARSLLSIKGPGDTAARKLSHDLVCLYHDSHRGAGDLSLLLERFILTL